VYTETDHAPSRPGSAGFLGQHTATQIALTMALAENGLEPDIAARMAGKFAFIGDAIHFNGETQIRRAPGEAYREGQTLLGVWRSEDDQWHGRVVNAVWTDNYPFILQKLTHGEPAPASPTTMLIIDCGEVLKRLEPLFRDDPVARRARILARNAKSAEADDRAERDALHREIGEALERVERKLDAKHAALDALERNAAPQPTKRPTKPQRTEPVK
jgi:hypothetical protein